MTPGMGVGVVVVDGGTFRTNEFPKIFRTKSVHSSGTFFKQMSNKSNSIFKICSYIQKTTHNLICTFKITLYNTKTHQQCQNSFGTFVNLEKTRTNKLFKFIFYYIYNFHNAYFIYFVYFVYFVLLYIHCKLRKQ